MTLDLLTSADRGKFFEFFDTNSFRRHYYELVKEVVEKLQMEPENVMAQVMPTPRIFTPSMRGTSLHCDHWYGHGRATVTIWVPLTPVKKGNTFRCLDANDSKILLDLLENKGFDSDVATTYFDQNAFDVLPGENEAHIFNSTIMHSSITNTTSDTRVSMDFRIAERGDTTSSKKNINFIGLGKNDFEPEVSNYSSLKCIKYICGGRKKDTLMQHLMIEDFAKRHNLNIVAQEAEIENMDFPMLSRSLANENEYDVVLIACRGVVEGFQFNFEPTSKRKKIVFCFEDELIEGIIF